MKIRFLIYLFFLTGISAFAQVLTSEQQSAIDEILLADIPADGPGGGLSIIRGGAVVYTKYAGLADLETGRKIDAKTRFNIASNAKQFTAIAVLRLVREGQLRLEDDIRRYLPALFPDIKEPITISQLINHTSGIRDVYNLWSFQGITWWKRSLDNGDAIKLIARQRDLNFPPGSQHLYSNSNYILLTEIVSKVSGQSFREYTNDMFRTIGFTNTNFIDNHKKMGINIGRPYFNFDTWTTYKWKTDLHGDGSLFSSLADQAKWEAAVQKGELPGWDKGLITESQQAVNGTTDYGYGLERGTYRGIPVTWHDGSTGAWDASFIRFPEHNLTVVAADNSGKFGTSRVVRAVADVLLADTFTEEAYLKRPTTFGAEIPMKQLAGTYLAENGYAFRLKTGDNALILQRDGRSDNELLLEKGNVYHQKYDTAFKQAFVQNEAGEMEVTAYYWAHAPFTLTRRNVDWTGYNATDLEGTYRNDELKVRFKVTSLGDHRYEFKAGRDKMRGKMYQRDKLLVDGNNIEVTRDASGRITGLSVNDGRVRKLKFERR